MSKEIQKKLEQEQTEDRKQSKFDYTKTAFMLKKPHDQTIYKGPALVRNQQAHQRLINIAKEKGLYLWHCSIIKDGNGKWQRVGQDIIEWATVPDHGGKGITRADLRDEPSVRGLQCHICHKMCHSTSGLTLHLKSHQQTTTSREEPIKAIVDADVLVCPDCGKRCHSTSGYTLHRKSVHGGANMGLAQESRTC